MSEKIPEYAEKRFDPEKHIYTLNGRRFPSVTEIVGDVVGTPMYGTEWHIDRGSKIHRAIALYLKGTLDESSLDERIRGRVEAAKKAIKELGIVPRFFETPMFHPALKFAGMPDLYTTDDDVMDWKSSHSPATEIQLGGYSLLIGNENHGHRPKRCVEIVLHENGQYTPTFYKPNRCIGLFLAALTIYQWKQKQGGF